jgi:hypothetical protein
MADMPKQGARKREPASDRVVADGGGNAPRKARASATSGGRAAATGKDDARGRAGGADENAFSLRPEDAMAFMQKMWNPFGVALPGFGLPGAPMAAAGSAAAPAVMPHAGNEPPAGVEPPASAPRPGSGHPGASTPFPPQFPFPNPAAMFVTLDPAEVGRKISELRIVEGWLRTMLGMMDVSIKTLELQKASLEALRAATGADAAPRG